ncbi:MAG: T9SS type A sorting domain-containing protein [Ignavibacteriae bacterium]|nr:T9SS type A sorting domain-containing protein [Ignavibacteriota bacterium]
MKRNHTHYIAFFLIAILMTTIGLAQKASTLLTKPTAAYPHSDDVFTTMVQTSSDVLSNSIQPKTSIMSSASSSLAGGNRLVEKQYTDGGWGWPLNAPPTYGNILGPIAMGLAQAYQQTGVSTQRTALTNAGAYLLTKTNNFSPSDGYLAAQLDKIFGGTTYRSHVKTNFYDQLAAGTYNRNGAGTLYSTASYVNLIRTSRASQGIGNMAAWDIGMGLVGAAMCDESTAEWIAGTKGEIDELDGDAYYDVIGLAGALYGLAFVNEEFDPTTGEHAAASNLTDLAAVLAGYQISGGGFAWNSNYVIPNDGNETIQETGYSILALNEINRATYLTNIQGAADYMMGVQLGTGGWENYPTSGENNEVTAEALWGISVAYPAPVHNITKDVYYPTIQGGVNDASSDDVIQVAAGTYKEQVNISKGITLLGDVTNPDNVVIDGENKTTLPSPGQVRMYNPTGNIVFKGFKMINGGAPSGGGNYYILTKGSYSKTIENCKIVGHGSGLPAGEDYGIWAYAGSGDIIIKESYFSEMYHAILVEKVTGTTTIENNTFDNLYTPYYEPLSGDVGGRAIEAITYGGTTITSLQKVTGNTFTNFRSTGIIFSGGFSGSGVGKYTNVEIEKNNFNFSVSSIVNNYGAINLRNVSSGGNSDPAGGVTAYIHNNFINVPSSSGIQISGLNGTVTCHDNSILGTPYGLKADAALTTVINTYGNWWGSNDPATVATKVTPTVDYTPWLNTATDTDGAIGFQGDFSVLNVGAASPQTGTTTRIQEGINLVSGSTVNVANGTYSEVLNINKANLTLIGNIADPSQVVINSGGLGGYGSPLTAIWVPVSGVTLKGFTHVGAGQTNSSNPRYAIKFSGNFNGATVEDVVIHDFYRAGLEFHTGSNVSVTDVNAYNNGGTGFVVRNVNGATLTNISTSNNTWGGMRVQTDPAFVTDNIVFTGTNSFGENNQRNGGLYTEEDPAGNPPTYGYDGSYNIQLQQADFEFALLGTQDDAKPRVRFYKTLSQAGTAATGTPAPDHLIQTAAYIRNLVDGELYVEPGMKIQAAVNGANAVDIINVATGTYSEKLNLNKSLTLNGAKAGVDARTRNTSTGESILDGTGVTGSQYDAIKIANGISNVIIDGFEIRNYAGSGSNGDGNAISSYCMSTNTSGANNVTIQNNYIHHLAYNGILVGSENNNTTSMIVQSGWVIMYNKIANFTYAGIELTNVINSQVNNNAIEAPISLFDDPGDAGVGIEIAARSRTKPVTAGTNVEVSNNTVTGNFPTGSRAVINLLSRTYSSTSNATLSGVTVSGNSISGATNVRAAVLAVAESRSNGPATISTLAISNNTLDGNLEGIQFHDYLKSGTGTATHSAITVTGNEIKNSTGVGLHVLTGTSAGEITVNTNKIFANALFGIKNEGTGILNATSNWWGHTTGPLDTKTLPGIPNYNNPNGQGNSVTSFVDYYPFYNNEGMTTLSTISIIGMKFNDLNGNGTKDAGDVGLSGWQIILAGGVVPETTLTDVDGNYAFNNLLPGTYTISEVVQSGWMQTTLSPSPLTVNPDDHVTGIDFGNFRLITISGQKYNDLDGDGVKDGNEPGISDWTMNLSGTATASATTDVNGNYQFTNLQPGTYIVREALQDGWLQTTTNPDNFVVTSGENISGVDFGNFRLISISGMKFNDHNGDGVKDENDEGLAGWTINLAGSATASATTDANGAYSFTALGPGTYTVTETVQDGWLQTTTNPSSITSSSGTNVSDINFGNFRKFTISGTKFDDTDGDGVKDNGEPGLSGWTINLTGTATSSTTTDASGNYSFANMGPGTYTVREVLQNGWIQTTTNPSNIVGSSGVNVSNINFGNFKTAYITGMKFNDFDGDGTKDAGDVGLSGWTIRATKGASTKNATTDANGNYSLSFTNTEAGLWTISEVLQTSWRQTYPVAGTYSITVQSGTNATDKTFGNYQLSTISGQKFNDLQGDSAVTSDQGLNNWVIKLYSNNQLLSRKITSGSGNYSFTDLSPGTYVVQESLQTNWIQTYPKEGTGIVAPVADANAGPRAYQFVLTSGTTLTGKHFGNFNLGYISGLKFEDMDGDSVKEEDDPLLANWVINLKKNGNIIESDTTDEAGNFGFDSLTVGTYEVCEVLQPDWYQTLPATPCYTFNVVSGSNFTGNIGNFEFGSISGYKFFDHDSNGVQDSYRDDLMDSLKVVLIGTHTAPETVMTDANGAFLFDPVPAGVYTIKELPRSEWRQTTPANGANYTVQMFSNLDTNGFAFGNFYQPDTIKFRTFSVGDYGKSAAAKGRSRFIKKPNAGNVRDSVYLNLGFGLETPSDSGYLRIGIQRYDSANFYGWFHYAYYKYRKGSFVGYHQASVAKYIYNLRLWKPSKQQPLTNYILIAGEKTAPTFFGNSGNHFTVELTGLKTNVAASDLGITPRGLGDLVFDKESGADTIFNGKTIRELIALSDSALTLGLRDQVKYPLSYLIILDTIVTRINREFWRPFGVGYTFISDTVSTSPLVVKGYKSLYKVNYLKRDPSRVTMLTRFAPTIAENGVPSQYRLEQNYPNPFNPMTTIEFELVQPSYVTLKIFNVLGQEVATLFEQQEMSEGMQAIEFDATNFASGVYFYKLEAKEIDSDVTTFNSVKKMMLVK